MVSKANYLTEIKALIEANGIDKIANALGTTSRAIGYWVAENGNKKPRRETQQKIHELFLNHTAGRPLEAQQGAGSGKDEIIIELLKEKNKRLEKDLDLSLGELRYNILLTRAIAATNQDLLIELLAKSRRVSPSVVVEDANKLFAEYYQKMKEEGKFADVGRFIL